MADKSKRKKKKKKQPFAPPPPPRSKQAIAICVAATVVLLGLDLWSKTWAEENISVARSTEIPVCEQDERGYEPPQRLATDAVVIVEDYIELRYAENCNAAFGMGSSVPLTLRKIIFGLAAIVATGVLFFMFATGRGGPLFAWSVPLVVSGAVGNLVDRVRYGYVIDFIRCFNLPVLGEWPTFNVADITITIGVVLLALDGFRKPAGETDDSGIEDALRASGSEE
ncbi:MAG: signal peptidase II [Myxococcota bacterium]